MSPRDWQMSHNNDDWISMYTAQDFGNTYMYSI